LLNTVSHVTTVFVTVLFFDSSASVVPSNNTTAFHPNFTGFEEGKYPLAINTIFLGRFTV
jgi:hypothetical protein